MTRVVIYTSRTGEQQILTDMPGVEVIHATEAVTPGPPVERATVSWVGHEFIAALLRRLATAGADGPGAAPTAPRVASWPRRGRPRLRVIEKDTVP